MAAAIEARNVQANPVNVVDPVVPQVTNETTQKVEKVAYSKGHFIGDSLVSGVSTLGALTCVSIIALSILSGGIVPIFAVFLVCLTVVFLAIAVYESYKAIKYLNQAKA